MTDEQYVWVFQGERAAFPAAIFTSKGLAVSWIERTGVSGMLSRYPLDQSVYDWAVAKDLFRPKREEHTSAEFIQQFSTAQLEDSQYVEGTESG